jgi:hypothetical protein
MRDTTTIRVCGDMSMAKVDRRKITAARRR